MDGFKLEKLIALGYSVLNIGSANSYILALINILVCSISYIKFVNRLDVNDFRNN